jgi:membrane-bound serine protease (ClpP class)
MAIEFYLVLLVAGLLMMGAEVFIPGGIIGGIGGLFLLGAIAISFQVFSMVMALYITAATVILVGISIVLWIKIFPRTGVGQRMVVTRDESTFKASPAALAALLGQEGIAACDLRPAGYVMFGLSRVDVVSDGMMIQKNSRVKVVKVEGFRVVVKPLVGKT